MSIIEFPKLSISYTIFLSATQLRGKIDVSLPYSRETVIASILDNQPKTEKAEKVKCEVIEINGKGEKLEYKLEYQKPEIEAAVNALKPIYLDFAAIKKLDKQFPNTTVHQVAAVVFEQYSKAWGEGWFAKHLLQFDALLEGKIENCKKLLRDNKTLDQNNFFHAVIYLDRKGYGNTPFKDVLQYVGIV